MFKFISQIMKSNKKPLLLSIFSLIGAFALLLVAVGSFAWYATNKNASVANMSLKVGADDVFATYQVYMKDDDGNVVSNKTLSDEVVVHTFDSVFTAKNRYNPIFIRITVTSDSLYSSSTVSSKNMNFTISRQDIQAADSVTSRYFTSVMQFAMALESPSASYDDATDLYSTVYSEYMQNYSNTDPTPVFKNAASPQSFVSGNSKLDSISFNLSYTSSSWKNNNGTHELNIFLMINYGRDLIVDGGFASSDMSAGLDNIAIGFTSDLDTITINTQENI